MELVGPPAPGGTGETAGLDGPAGGYAGEAVTGHSGRSGAQEKEAAMGKPNPIEVQKALKGIRYPADTSSLAEQARKNHADKDLVQRMENLKGRKFDGPNDVEKAIFD
ncbi:DUF2795 domain-containing protein [Streptomyces sp. RFCAC02]|uniref:DUF2795 domain-containing protein n=1 Tax=Streptomyces sp. RFCAC02 TaxID=2499143 RepID=UPI003208D7D6